MPVPPRPEDLEEVRRQIRRRLREAGVPHTGAAPGRQPTAPMIHSRTVPAVASPRRVPQGLAARPAAALHETVPGREVKAPGGARAYLAPTRLAELDGRWRTVEANLCRALERPGAGLAGCLGQLGLGAGLTPEKLLFVDLETTGLAASPLFLVGTLVWSGAGLEVRQYLARDYSEEAAVLSLFAREAESRTVLVTFNGKSFDLPYLRVRAAALRVRLSPPEAHLDLLHVARRLWKGRFPDCRLQTLERHLCGRMREDDIPGSEIPQAYHDFVRTGDASLLAEIMRHNLLDLATLSELLTRLPD